MIKMWTKWSTWKRLLWIIGLKWLYSTSDGATYTSTNWLLFCRSRAWHDEYCQQYSHVVIINTDYQSVYMIDPSYPIPLFCKISDCDDKKSCIDIINDIAMRHKRGDMLLVECDIKIDNGVMVKFGRKSCTDFVRYFTGCKSRGFTPYRFYKNLLKSGEGVKWIVEK